MTLRSFRALAMAVACVFGLANVQAEGLEFGADLLFLRGHTTSGGGTDNAFGYETGHRFSLAKSNCCDFGSRLTYFQWDHAAADAQLVGLGIDTYNIDGEVFKRLDLTNLTSVEFSGGIRYNEFESQTAAATLGFHGFGGILGLKANHKVGTGGRLYASGKWAVVMGDEEGTGNGTTGFDAVRNQMEISSGYEHDFCLGNGVVITPHAGATWMSYENYIVDAGGPNQDFGLGGFLFGLNVTF